MRFADPAAVDTFEVACPCPGMPHEVDTITHRTELGSGELESVGQYGWQRGSAQDFGFYDESAAMSMLIVKAVTHWTLVDGVDKDGKPAPRPVTIRTAELLPSSIRAELRARLELAANWDTPPEEGEPVPNGSGAPSQSISQESASPTRTNGRRR
jgi:hypothetical protein